MTNPFRLITCWCCGYTAPRLEFSSGYCPACCRDMNTGAVRPGSIPTRYVDEREIRGKFFVLRMAPEYAASRIRSVHGSLASAARVAVTQPEGDLIVTGASPDGRWSLDLLITRNEYPVAK